MKYAVVGAGLSGATVAHLLAPYGDVTVFEKEPVVGGACYTERDPTTGIMVHKYGPHIFHTASLAVRMFMTKFGDWMPFDLRMKSVHDLEVYSGPPINLHTMNQYYDTCWTPAEARRTLQKKIYNWGPKNFEEAAIATVGQGLYEAFLQAYTIKQWGRNPTEIPASVFQRLPIRFDYDDRKYPAGEWQAIPREGYTQIIKNMLDRITVVLSAHVRNGWAWEDYDWVFWTGPIDEYFKYQYGRLPYRTVTFEPERATDDLGAPVVCFPDPEDEYTRITSHGRFEYWVEHPWTYQTKEYSKETGPGDRPFYPVHLAGGSEMLQKYQELAKQERKVTFLGRLGTFKYIDMDRAVSEAMQCVENFKATILPSL